MKNKIPKLFKISINTNYKLFNVLLKLKSEINKIYKLFKILNKHKSLLTLCYI